MTPEDIAEIVRKASGSGDLVDADTVCPDGVAEWESLVDAGDIQCIREGAKCYLFSDRYMTRPFAEAAALGLSRDAVRMIAATVRSESATYPRPTPAETFQCGPYFLAADEIATAVACMGNDPEYSDVGTVRASNGAEFLFSSRHLHRDQAASIAEWLAVAQYENP